MEWDAPLSETHEQYGITVTGSLSTLDLSTDQPSLTVPANSLASIGAGQAAIEVRQIGDLAASHPAQLKISLA